MNEEIPQLLKNLRLRKMPGEHGLADYYNNRLSKSSNRARA